MLGNGLLLRLGLGLLLLGRLLLGGLLLGGLLLLDRLPERCHSRGSVTRLLLCRGCRHARSKRGKPCLCGRLTDSRLPLRWRLLLRYGLLRQSLLWHSLLRHSLLRQRLLLLLPHLHTSTRKQGALHPEVFLAQIRKNKLHCGLAWPIFSIHPCPLR